MHLPVVQQSVELKTYKVVEVFKSVQGEGFWVGTPMVFVRFKDCNSIGSCMGGWCDTNFTKIDEENRGGIYSATELADVISAVWGRKDECRVVLTGGEPLLQVDSMLVMVLRDHGFLVHVETNGSLPLPLVKPDWVTVSPKPPTNLIRQEYDEVKVVYPVFDPEPYTDIAPIRWLQPLEEDEEYQGALIECFEYSMEHPEWRVGVQLHKMIGVE